MVSFMFQELVLDLKVHAFRLPNSKTLTFVPLEARVVTSWLAHELVCNVLASSPHDKTLQLMTKHVFLWFDYQRLYIEYLVFFGFMISTM